VEIAIAPPAETLLTMKSLKMAQAKYGRAHLIKHEKRLEKYEIAQRHAEIEANKKSLTLNVNKSEDQRTDAIFSPIKSMFHKGVLPLSSPLAPVINRALKDTSLIYRNPIMDIPISKTERMARKVAQLARENTLAVKGILDMRNDNGSVASNDFSISSKYSKMTEGSTGIAALLMDDDEAYIIGTQFEGDEEGVEAVYRDLLNQKISVVKPSATEIAAKQKALDKVKAMEKAISDEERLWKESGDERRLQAKKWGLTELRTVKLPEGLFIEVDDPVMTRANASHANAQQTAEEQISVTSQGQASISKPAMLAE
jgi:hypothetical protein